MRVAGLDRLMAEKATRKAERRLADFAQQGWRVLEPTVPLAWNWHLDAICEHLEAVTLGQISNLVINVPPGCMKSYLTSVLWPAWEWARKPDLRYLCASFDQGLSTRDNMRVRDLVQSQWYMDRWPLRLREDQNAKTRFNTVQGGWRIGTSVGGKAIGEHPHRKIIDDPHKIKKQGTLQALEMLSDADLEAVIHWYSQTMSLRGLALGAATVIVMQRLHQRDLAGHVLDTLGAAATHLCLPMEHEPGRTRATSIGWSDPRTADGELLWPAMFPAATVAAAKVPMGSWGTASQFQQRPAPKEGAMFKEAWIRPISAMPRKIVSTVRFWDVAGTEGGTGPRTVGLRMSLSADGLFVISDIVKGRWGEKEVDDQIKATAVKDGRHVPVREEQEPGSSGKAVVKARQRQMRGIDFKGLPPDADKVTRARPLRSQAEAGNLRFLVRPDNEADRESFREYCDEMKMFPHGALKDQVDASSGALSVLTEDDIAGQASLDDGAAFPLYY